LVESQLTARLGDPATMIVDIRSDAERADDVDQTISLGSIPGSIRLPWTSLLDADGQLLSPDVLASTIAGAGIDAGSNVVIYGLFGTDTGLSWLAFRVAGYSTVAIYDGGWNEWARDPATPKAPV
jgi:thiosulfate/3-mercaptopyruvate sulfurtransferase